MLARLSNPKSCAFSLYSRDIVHSNCIFNTAIGKDECFPAAKPKEAFKAATYYTDTKEKKIFLIYKEIQSGAVAKSYKRKVAS
jgi:hypothetical protein